MWCKCDLQVQCPLALKKNNIRFLVLFFLLSQMSFFISAYTDSLVIYCLHNLKIIRRLPLLTLSIVLKGRVIFVSGVTFGDRCECENIKSLRWILLQELLLTNFGTLYSRVLERSTLLSSLLIYTAINITYSIATCLRPYGEYAKPWRLRMNH